jgi:aryl sulfotransferase
MSEQTEIGTATNSAPEFEMEGWAPVMPYFDLKVQQEIDWRDGDIVISVPVKCGTTWTMNIVHQLRSGGDSGFDDVYLEVPWLELVTSRSASRQDLIRRFDSMPTDRHRAFKTHSAVGELPYLSAEQGKDVRYVVVLRNPDEVLASLYPFMQSMSPGWYDYWGIDPNLFAVPDFGTYYDGFAKMMLPPGLFGFLAAWWPLRNQPNVLLVHFSDMKRDHAGTVQRIADFLGYAPTADQMVDILEFTSFAWMKAHEDKFEARLAAEVPILQPGGMVRKGKTGAAREDGVTPEMSAEVAALGKGFLPDQQAFDWIYAGGALP